MRLFHKIFLYFIIIFGITFQATGYLMINYAYGNAVEQEKRLAFQEFQYNSYILQSALYSTPDLFSKTETAAVNTGDLFTVPMALYSAEEEYIFSNMTADPRELHFSQGADGEVSFEICEAEDKRYIFVWNYVSQGETGLYLVTQTDITSVVENQKGMIAYFQKLYIAILCTSLLVIFILTKAVTISIKRVERAAKRIADGKYSERIATKGKDEISELAFSFNRMAGQVEEKIAALSDVARQKEDFAANFAHELKTPLTSVIGYADMLYQRALPRETVKEAAGYILSESMRLEALSLKLMDLFVLDKQDFFLENMSIREMFEDIEKGIAPMCWQHRVALHMDIHEGCIAADYDLFKTLFLNLADNSIKADCRDIWITGACSGNQYRITTCDNGKGIPPEELGKITEAFYMVDKSRARKQHGAGLGMALVAKIVEIHSARMNIESDGTHGTSVSIVFPKQEENENV